jgi:hypothetical protein
MGSGSYLESGEEQPSIACPGSDDDCRSGEWGLLSIGQLDAGESRTITIPVRQNSPTDGTPWVSHVRVTDGSGAYTLGTKPTILFNKSTEQEMQMVIESDTFSPQVGSLQSFNIKVGNVTGSALDSGLLRLQIPTGYSFESASGRMEQDGDFLVWPVGNLPDQQWLQESVVLKVASGLQRNHALILRAFLVDDSGRGELASASLVSLVEVGSKLELSYIDSFATPISDGSVITLTQMVSNNSDSQLADVNLRTLIPAFTEASSIDSATNCGSSCNGAEWATWDLGNLDESDTISRSILPVLATRSNAAPAGQLLIANSHLVHSSSVSVDQVLTKSWGVGTEFSVDDNHDSDGDQIPDWWEIRYSSVMNRLDASDQLEDPDNDGFTNLDEYTRGFITPLPAESGYDPTFQDPRIPIDSDNDGLFDREEIAIGSDINNTDTDDDGIGDLLDNQPTVAYVLEEGVLQVMQLQDINNDGTDDIGIFKVTAGEPSMDIHSGADFSIVLRTLLWEVEYRDIVAHIIPDMNGNGFDEIGVFGMRTDETSEVSFEGRFQMFIRDSGNGNQIGRYNWVANWLQASALILDDLTGDGISEIAMQGRLITRDTGGRPQLFVRNGATKGAVTTYSFPSLFIDPQWAQFSDLNGDGIGDISLFGTIARNGKLQAKIVDGTDKNNKLRAYNFPALWDSPQWIRLPDVNDDNIDDWGMFGIRKDDNRPQLINKNGAQISGTINIFAWTGAIIDPSFFIVPDMNTDGVDDIAVGGIRTNGRYQLQIQNAKDRTEVLANHNINVALSDVTFAILPDFNGDGKVEIGLFGENVSSEFVIIVRNAASPAASLREINLGSNWQSKPKLLNINDVNSDNVDDIMVWGKSIMGIDQQIIISGADGATLN